jgi:polyhydroxyalkanoate synthesis repressor PhaR
MNDNPRQLTIKKYSNRRFYDTTRSCSLGLSGIHDLVAQGYDVAVVDSKTGLDITNSVLMQIILDRQADKLTAFPPAILHQIIRTQRQFLGSVVQQFFRQSIEAQRDAQEQWTRFMESTFGYKPPTPPNPLEWTRSFMEAMTGDRAPAPPPPVPADADDSGDEDEDEIETLRRQVRELSRQVARLTGARTKRGD